MTEFVTAKTCRNLYLSKNLSQQRREPTTNLAHIWHQRTAPGLIPGPCWWDESALTMLPPSKYIDSKFNSSLGW